MKDITIIALLLFCSVHAFAEDQKVNKLVSSIKLVLPEKWKVLPPVYYRKPDWSFSNDKCFVIHLYGPEMSGYKYYKKDGSYIGKKRIFNEAVFLWIADKKFNPKLSLKNKIINRFQKVPKNLPTFVLSVDTYTVFGREDRLILPENDQLFKTSPEGTHSAIPFEFEKRSWPTWQRDLKKLLQSDSHVESLFLTLCYNQMKRTVLSGSPDGRIKDLGRQERAGTTDPKSNKNGPNR